MQQPRAYETDVSRAEEMHSMRSREACTYWPGDGSQGGCGAVTSDEIRETRVRQGGKRMPTGSQAFEYD